MQPETRYLQDMRDPQKFQLSKDKFSLQKVSYLHKNHTVAHPTPATKGPGGQNITMNMQHGQNYGSMHQNMVRMSQANSNPVFNNQNANGLHNSPGQQQMANTTDTRGNGMHSKNKSSIIGNQNEVPERSSATNSLRGASTTIGRAGEQIMGALSSKK